MPAQHKSDSPRKLQKAATAQAILEAAREEFERVGFEAANLRAIAQRAGVSAASIIHHHGDKRELLYAALFDDLAQTLDAALAAQAAPDATLEQTLDQLTRSVFGYYQRRPALSRALLRESLFAQGDWAPRFVQQTTQVHAYLAKTLRAAQQAGEIRADADPALFGVAYLSFFYFGLISWAQGAHPDPASLVHNLTAQHLTGLRPQTTPEQHP